MEEQIKINGIKGYLWNRQTLASFLIAYPFKYD